MSHVKRLTLVIGSLALGIAIYAQAQTPKLDIHINMKPYVLV